MILFSSDRLIYKKLTNEYLEEFCQMDMDPEVMKYYTSRSHGTREDALKSFNRYADYMKINPSFGGFMAFLKDTNEFVGLGVLIHLELNQASPDYEVGYRLPVHQWGKGYATEIAQALIQYGFETLKLKEIFGTTNPDNKVSEKVLEKCGLVKIGTTSNYGGSNFFKLSNPKV